MYEAEIAGVEEEKRQEVLDSVPIYYGKEMTDWTRDIYFKEYLTGNDKGLLVGAIREMHGIGALATFLGARSQMTMKEMPGQEGVFLIPAVQVSVSSNTRDKELAEAFVKVILGKKAQLYKTMEGFAVNWESFELMVEEVSSHWSYGRKDINGNYADWDNLYPSEEGMSLFQDIIQSEACISPSDQQTQDIVVKYGSKVLEGKISLEEGMKVIHKNIFVYLAE